MPSRIPLLIKLAYTAFVAVLVPIYLKDYGPTNFLYFCDIALLLTVPALWLESPLLASMAAVSILLLQLYWIVDFLAECVGLPLAGMTAYMFDPQIPLFTRCLSFFHFWLPLFVFGLVWRLGYDRRAFPLWSALAVPLLLVCYFLMPPPPAPADNPNLPVNINYVYGLGAQPQQMMPPLAYLGVMMVVLLVGVYWPTHLVLQRWFGRSTAQ